MPQFNENTKLLSDVNKPEYVFDSSIVRERRRRIKQFQCCLCAIFICIFVMALVATVSYSINSLDDDNNSTNMTNITVPVEVSILLMTNSWPLQDKNSDNYQYCNDTEWINAMAAGEKALKSKDLIEENVKPLEIDSPSYRHQKVTATSKTARTLSQHGYKEEFAARHLFMNNNNKFVIKNVCYKNNQSQFCVNKNILKCNVFQKFRTYNGSCNNLKHPNDFGVAYSPFRRALPPNYADGISTPRMSKDRKPLPTARTVSLVVHRPYYRDNQKFSVMLAVWGQFLDHDITATAASQGANGTTISCCNQQDLSSHHPECFPVMLDAFDPFSRYNTTCMEFVRSAPAPTCCLGPRQQMNQMTSFIDGSVIYGHDESLVKKLRLMKKGEMKMFVTEDNRTLLPLSDDPSDGCNRKEQGFNGKYCFMTGDARANENLHLTSMHLIWARHHNFLAKKLSLLNSDWDDELIFQESRRILAAQMQHITYKEFLPILLGPKLMEKYELYPKEAGYFTKYNDSIDPSIANNFATAAFRFAHTLIPGLMKLLSNDTSSPEYVQLHQMLFDPFKLYQPGELDRTLRGAMDTTVEASDPYFTNELKQHLFERKSEVRQCGLDLVSLNIQRGRDHGLVGYNSWREHCGLRRVRTFKQLYGDVDDESLRNIQTIYRNVDDIDLYTGALSEKPIKDSILGPTITCLILDQFIRIKYGDRFWYETPQKPQGFSIEQLHEIRKTSLAQIICDNSDHVEFAQPLVMEKIRQGNEIRACSDIPAPDYAQWKNRPVHVKMSGDDSMVMPTRMDKV